MFSSDAEMKRHEPHTSVPTSANAKTHGSVGIKKTEKSQNRSMSPFMGSTHTQLTLQSVYVCVCARTRACRCM